MAQKRFVSAITVFTYGDNAKEAYDNAQKLANSINEKFEGHSASIENFHSKDWGVKKATEIDIETLKD